MLERGSHTHKHTKDPLTSPDPEKLSREVSATEEAISLLLIGSVLTANKEATMSLKAPNQVWEIQQQNI